MLVLSRKLNEEITIGDDIKVTVLQIKGNSIRLGIEAPKNVRIIRGEIPVAEPDSQVTVVLSGQREDRGVNIELLPFERAERGSQRDPNRTGELSHQSIEFRERLPKSLQRTRLQQIVNEITNK